MTLADLAAVAGPASEAVLAEEARTPAERARLIAGWQGAVRAALDATSG